MNTDNQLPNKSAASTRPFSASAAVWSLLILLAGAIGRAAEPAIDSDTATAADKRGYNFFKPTPATLLRELSTDRPDKTECPYTLDAGHFQVEMDLVSYTHDHDQAAGANTRVDAFAIAPVNLKVGLLNSVDLQLVLDTYNHVRTEDRVAGSTGHQSGFGDITVRLKKNFWGNDGGRTALAVMPFIKIPANQDGLGNHATEGGIIVPLGIELSRGWGLCVMTEFDFLQNEDDHNYHASFINTITCGHDIIGNLGGYVEFFSEVSSQSNTPWVGTVDLGLTYGLTENIQLDAGINLGVTKAADDLNPFVGLSVRF